MAVSLEHAVPISQRNAANDTDAPKHVDPVNRYLHFEKAYLDGELDPGFPDLSVWDYRWVVDGEEPDEILTWGREMLRNYRPDHIRTDDYRWRYVALVRTDIKYGSTENRFDKPELQFFQNILMNGGVCGRRAFIGRFILRAFGIPTVPRPQRGHAALAHWTPDGWVVCLGGGWGAGYAPEKYNSDLNFLAETQGRATGKPYAQVKRAQWVGDVMGEKRCAGLVGNEPAFWNAVALYRQHAIIDQAKTVTLAAVGEELGEANESNVKYAIEAATVTEADQRITVDANGAITIPAVACSTPTQSTNKIIFMQSHGGGKQLHYSRNGNDQDFEYTFDVPAAGRYALTARVVTPSWKQHTDGHKIIYRNANALGSARFIGGRALTGKWTPDADGIYKINVGAKPVPHTLYVDGVRMRKARFPNHEHDERFPSAAAPYLVTTAGESTGKPGYGSNASNPTWVAYKEGDFDPAKLDLSQLRINTFPWGKCDWHRMLCKVTEIDTEQRRIYFDNHDQKNPQKEKQRYFLEDDRSFLDAPGEFFFDEKTGWLYLIPHDGKDPTGREVIVPATTTLVRLTGQDGEPIHDIRFEGLCFYGTNLDSPAPYAWQDQDAMMPITHADRIEIVNCHFANGGRSAISVQDGRNLVIYGNWIHHMGMNGIVMFDTEFSLISNNKIHDTGYLQLYAECIGLFKTHNVEVSHCELFNSARYGITVRGHCKTQGKYSYHQGTAASFNNRFHHLKIYGVNQDSGDTGGLHVAQINSKHDPYYNFFDQITIDRSYAVPGMNDLAPNGIFLDWPGQSQHQRLSNIEITNAQGKPFRTNRNRGASVLNNVSWQDGFDKSKMAYKSIGLMPDFPKEFGGKGAPAAMPSLRPAPKSLYAHYPMDGQINDARGVSTANSAGAPAFTADVKRVGTHAVRFDGEEDLITLTTDLRGDFTIALWARYEKQTPDASAWRPLVYSGADFDKGAIVITSQRDGAADPGRLSFGIDTRQSFDIGFDDGKWHFLTLTRTGDTWTAYHNGQLLGQGKINTFQPDSMCLQIGGDRDVLGKEWKRQFKGHIDDLKTYNVALSDTEIAKLYAAYK